LVVRSVAALGRGLIRRRRLRQGTEHTSRVAKDALELPAFASCAAHGHRPLKPLPSRAPWFLRVNGVSNSKIFVLMPKFQYHCL
jgi:hypothetical protein